MRIPLSIVCTLLLAVTSSSALNNNECYQATRGIVVPLLSGEYKEMGPTTIEKPGGWENWITIQFKGPGEFNAFKIVKIESNRKGCWAGVRFNKSEGNIYALFAEFDKHGYLTKLTSIRELLELRQEQLQGTLSTLNSVLPKRNVGEIDDLELLESLRQIAKTARQSREEVKKYIDVLEDAVMRAESGLRIRE